jgi:hypothetical protein
LPAVQIDQSVTGRLRYRPVRDKAGICSPPARVLTGW